MSNMVLILPIDIEPGLGDALVDANSENVIDANDEQIYVFGDGIMYSNVAPVDAGEDEWDAGETYSIGDIVTVLGDVQRRFESLTNDNVGNDPVDSPAEWLDLGFTNRWRMFDGGTSTTTTNDDSIAIRIRPDGFVNALSFFNVSASSIRIIISQNGETVYDQTADFILELGESNWFSWFFGSVQGVIETPRDHVVLGIPGLFNATIDVIFSRPDGEVSVGLLVAGRQQTIGVGLYGSSVGIRDFSTKEVDQFGNFRVVERRFAKRAEMDVYLRTNTIATVQQALAARRASPTVYVGSDQACLFCADPIHEEFLVYGFFNDFDIVTGDRQNSTAVIEVEGL